MEMIIKRDKIYSAEDVINNYVKFSNNPTEWPAKDRDRTYDTKQKILEWYLILSLYNETRDGVLLEELKAKASNLPEKISKPILKELSKTSYMPISKKIDIINTEVLSGRLIMTYPTCSIRSIL